MAGGLANGGLIARQTGPQQRSHLDLALLHGFLDAGGHFTGAPFREGFAQPQERRLEDRHGQWDWLAGQGGHTARELGRQVLRRKRQAWQAPMLERLAEVGDNRQEPPLEGDGR